MEQRYRVLGTVAVVVMLIATVGVVVGTPHEQSDGSQNETAVDGQNETAAANETATDSQDETRFVVEQGEECTPIDPLSYENDTAERFYGYVGNQSGPSIASAANTPVALEHRYENASSLFLYEDSDGISLVVIHDRAGHRDRDGGAVSMQFSNVSRDTQWVVRDDPDDMWQGTPQEQNRRTWTVDWQWTEGYTDGGVLKGGFDGNTSIQVTPEFNTAGTINEWQVLSGSATDPNRTSLDMDRPITVRTGTC